MGNSIAINNQNVLVKQYKGQRVLTFKDIDMVHGRPEGTARRNFNSNKKHFIEGEDYYKIQPDEIRTVGFASPNGGTVVTESGYLMLAKSFTDDLSWEVQRQIVNSYFKYKATNECKQLTFEEYNYFDKKYNGEYVLSTMDVSALTNINTTTISWYARAHLNGGVDYYFISGDKLREFKAENPKVSKLASGLTVFTKSGFEKICRAYNIKVDTPHPFIKAAFKPKAELEKKERKLNTLGFEVERAVILENPKIQSYIKEITGCLKAMETLLMLYNSDDLSIESAKRKADSICDIAAAITGKSVALYCTKLETKIVKY